APGFLGFGCRAKDGGFGPPLVLAIAFVALWRLAALRICRAVIWSLFDIVGGALCGLAPCARFAARTRATGCARFCCSWCCHLFSPCPISAHHTMGRLPYACLLFCVRSSCTAAQFLLLPSCLHAA